jgi:hypothetical protein
MSILIVAQRKILEGVLLRGAIPGGHVFQYLPRRIDHPCPDDHSGFVGTGTPLTTGDPNHGKNEKGKQVPGQGKFQTIHHDVSLKTILHSTEGMSSWTRGVVPHYGKTFPIS